MCQAIAKNTFLSFVVDDKNLCDVEPSLRRGHASMRAKSADSGHCRPSKAAQQQQMLQRLNTVLSIGMCGGVCQQAQVDAGECANAPQRSHEDVPDQPGNNSNLSELQDLQAMLGKALAKNGDNSQQTTMDSMRRIGSNCSLSTMDSECDDLASAASNTSVITVASDHPRPWSSESDVDRSDKNHKSVPRTKDLQEVYKNEDKGAAPTTMMIRNVPFQYSQQDLLQELTDLGFGGTFDFLYLPLDKSTTAGVGYAFVNFIAPSWAKKCEQTFRKYRFRLRRGVSTKAANVSVAYIQGLEKNLQHYQNSAVNASKNSIGRPLVMAKISNVLG
jgi:hypothetical protein